AVCLVADRAGVSAGLTFIYLLGYFPVKPRAARPVILAVPTPAYRPAREAPLRRHSASPVRAARHRRPTGGPAPRPATAAPGARAARARGRPLQKCNPLQSASFGLLGRGSSPRHSSASRRYLRHS